MSYKVIFIGTQNFATITKVPTGGFFLGFDSNNGNKLSKINSALVITVIEGAAASTVDAQGINIANDEAVTTFTATGITSIIGGKSEVGATMRNALLANVNTNITAMSFPNTATIVGNIQVDTCSVLTSLLFAALTSMRVPSDFIIRNNDVLPTLSFPLLTTITGCPGCNIIFTNHAILTSISMPVFATFTSTNPADVSSTLSIEISGNLLLTSISLPVLASVSNCRRFDLTIDSNPVLTTFTSVITATPTGNGGAITISGNNLLTTLSFAALTTAQDISIVGNPVLNSMTFSSLLTCNSINMVFGNTGNTVSFPALTSSTTSVNIDGTNATSISFPVYTTAGTNFFISNNASLTSLNLNSLTTLTAGNLAISANVIITTISIASLVNVGANTITISSNTALTTITMNANCDGLDFIYTANALTQANVDAILALLDAKGGINGAIDMSGGTNSPASAAGLVSAGNLTGKGWTVTLNP